MMPFSQTLLVTALFCGVAFAQPTSRTDGLSRRLDRSGDGQLKRDEVPPAAGRIFDRLDADKNGVVTAREAASFNVPGIARGGATGPTGVPITPNRSAVRPHGQEAVDAGLDPEALATLDGTLQGHVDAKNVAGLIGFISKAGNVGYFEAFGWQDIEAQKPMSKDAIFRLQSMTKPIVAACALTLFDEGLFTLDEPISKHCPEWAEPIVREDGEDVPARNALTPRMLMSHSSGLYYGTIDGGPFSGGARSRGARTSLEAYSQSLAEKPLKFHPGEGYSYGTSIDILGRYIEAVTGQPLDVVMKERILTPLKMTDTDFWVPPEKAHRVAQIYSQPKPGVLARGREAAQLTTKPTLFLGGQGLCSTTDDYSRFCQMLLNKGELDGVRLLKAETVELMFQDHLQVNAKRLGLAESRQKYGLGGAVDGESGYLWGGANGTQFWIDSRGQFYAIFMVQTQRYKAPTYGDFRRLAGEAAGIDSTRGLGMAGQRAAGAGSPLGDLFKQRDTNGDGKLDRDEVRALHFNRLDADRDGFVSEEEAKKLWRPQR